jgi:hypothetical protein
MRMHTEYINYSQYDFQTHQQHSQRQWFISQPAPLWFKVLSGCLLVLPDLSWALPETLAYHRHSQASRQRTQVLLGAPADHGMGPVHSGIWPPCDSGLTTFRHSQRLPVTKMHFGDALTTDFSRWQYPWVYKIHAFWSKCHLSPFP